MRELLVSVGDGGGAEEGSGGPGSSASSFGAGSAPSVSSPSAAAVLSVTHFPSAKMHLDALFQEFLGEDSTAELLNSLLQSAKLSQDAREKMGGAGAFEGSAREGGGAEEEAEAEAETEVERAAEDESVPVEEEGGPQHARQAGRGTRTGVRGKARGAAEEAGDEDQAQRLRQRRQEEEEEEDDDEDDARNTEAMEQQQQQQHQPAEQQDLIVEIPQLPLTGKPHSRHPIPGDSLAERLPQIEQHFRVYPQGIPASKFVQVTKHICGFPSYFNVPLCVRIIALYDQYQPRDRRDTLVIRMKPFLKFWRDEIAPYDYTARFFRLVKQPSRNWIDKDDFFPFINELLAFHPGLEFLESHDEFQSKYALTVITRIFFLVNLSRTGRITLRELRRSNLVQEFMHVDEEEEINKVTEYFSYEHFYVLYCRFFELDENKDARLAKEDLLKYAEHSLSERIVERIFQVGHRPFGVPESMETSGMGFADFIFFMLSEEDKTSEASVRYWFDCLDLDGDQVVTRQDMNHFYRAQLHRMVSLGQDSVSFEDMLCQMLDMIMPHDEFELRAADFMLPVSRNISGVLFDALFNLNKFLTFENRDPFCEKQKRDDPFVTDWDRFAFYDYKRLSAEEEPEDTMDVEGAEWILAQDPAMDGDMGIDVMGGRGAGRPHELSSAI